MAIAADAAGQTATAVRTVTVDRFDPESVSLSLKLSKDTKAPYKFTVGGTINLPDNMSRSTGCNGVVAVRSRPARRPAPRARTK